MSVFTWQIENIHKYIPYYSVYKCWGCNTLSIRQQNNEQLPTEIIHSLIYISIICLMKLGYDDRKKSWNNHQELKWNLPSKYISFNFIICIIVINFTITTMIYLSELFIVEVFWWLLITHQYSVVTYYIHYILH